MSTNGSDTVAVEYYEPHDIEIPNICTMTLFRKTGVETIVQPKDILMSFVKDEDLFLSWLSSLSSSKTFPLARAVLKVNGIGYEAVYTSIRSSSTLGFPFISRVKRIYVFTQLKPQELLSETGEIILRPTQSSESVLLYDFSSDELYIFHSPIKLTDPSKAVALAVETTEGILYARTDEIMQRETTPRKRRSTKRKRSRKRRKKKRRIRKSKTRS